MSEFRLEALAQDAELEEHSAEELKRLAEALLEGCEKAELEHAAKANEVKVGDCICEKCARLCNPLFRLIRRKL